ncbi:MAG: hypothetical protein ACT4PV_08190 [Planctomycetaceae bacterium]
MRSPAPLCLLLLAGAAAADEIVSTTGVVTRDVKVLEQTAEKVVYLDKTLRAVTFPASVVRSVARKRSTIHEYEENLAAAKDADALVALAGWAEKKGFAKAVVRSLFERALELDPAHETANRVLGRVLHEGVWMTPEERDARAKDAEESAMREKGLVRHGDEWVTPEDKAKLEQGLKPHKGRWLTEDQIKQEEGYVKHEGRWIKKDDLEIEKLTGWARKATGLGDQLRLAQTEQYAVMGDLADNEMETLAQAMQALLAEWMRVFPDIDPQALLPGKQRLYAFKKNPPYQMLVRALFEEQKRTQDWPIEYAKQEEERMKLRLRETNFWMTQPEILTGHVQMPDPFEGLKAHCVHFGGNVLATRAVHARRFPTWWLMEGLSYYLERRITGTIQTFNTDVGGGGYADAGAVESTRGAPGLAATPCTSRLSGPVPGGRDPKLEAIKGKDLYALKNRLTTGDLAKAWSVVTYLIEDDAKLFAAFFADAKGGGGGDPVERETAAVLKHYGSYSKIDEGWKKYALNGFRVVR